MKRARVLLAEDDEDHRFFTVRAFQDAYGTGVEVHAVPDGEEALRYLAEIARTDSPERPHLIVLDLRMPRVDGLQVLEQVKQDAALRDIPVVVLSSSDRPEDVDGSYARGANSYVTKPQQPGGLRDSMRELARYWLEVSTPPGSRDRR